MVHKCSEYRLQFRQLTNDIRAEIWKENVTLRELLRRNNLSDHYWRYQLIDETCECDGVLDNETVGPTSSILPPTAVNLRHQHSGFADQGVQTPDRARSTIDNCSGYKNDDAKAVQLEPMSSPKETSLEETKESVNRQTAAESASFPKTNITSVPMEGGYRNKISNEDSRSNPIDPKTDYWKDDSAMSHLNPSPTRDALKFYKKEKKPVFVAFGWNDSNKDVGDKKTHNVLAPLDQVNQPALQALRNRQKELEKFFASQRGWKRHQQSHLSLGPIDHNVWITEYQEKFCREPRDFIYNPNKIHSHQRPVVWRHS